MAPAHDDKTDTPSDVERNPLSDTITRDAETGTRSWPALWAMMLGFFMITVDSTIVAVANPTIMVDLKVDYAGVLWVTSAYLLAYAVLLLLAARLGDRFGLKKIYLIGLGVFTLASVACGLSGSIGVLAAARVVQGVGAACITPQTLSIITRLFPADRRGSATALWAATGGIGTLVGPLAGGILVDNLGWQWIFLLNIPLGAIGLALAARLVPSLPLRKHHFDTFGVALSAASVFLIVFALQQGHAQHWSRSIWAMIIAGLACGIAFVYWQARNTREPLVPLRIFTDRNFSVSTFGYTLLGFSIASFLVPVYFYAQFVCGLSPTRSALLTAPISITMALLARTAGRISDRVHPRIVIGVGFVILVIGLISVSSALTPTTPIWEIVVAMIITGIGLGFTWSPLAATATRNLDSNYAGAGSGVYNAMRQIGSALGSAGMAAYMTARVNANLPGLESSIDITPESSAQLPSSLHENFARAMAQSLHMPLVACAVALIAALLLVTVDKAVS